MEYLDGPSRVISNQENTTLNLIKCHWRISQSDTEKKKET